MTEREKFLASLTGELGSLLAATENHFGENAAGTYPTEVEMTLRLAFLTASRALSATRESEVVPS